MKAERRHELHTNELARGIQRFPDFWKKHGNKLLLGGLVLALAIFLTSQYMQSRAAGRQTAANALSQARNAVTFLRDGRYNWQPGYPAKELSELRRQMLSETESNLAIVGANALDDMVIAEAKVTRGDLLLLMAMLNPIPGAAQSPELALPRTPEQFQSEARAVYEEVVAMHGKQAMSVASARMGLATIAENHHEWDAAERYYQAIKGDATLPKAIRQLAESRLTALATLRKPVWMTPTTAPAVAPVPLGPAGPPLPSTAPSAAPAPTTQPGS